MGTHRIAARLIHNAKRVGTVLLVVSTTGCMTTLGYVPEYPKKSGDGWMPGADFQEEIDYKSMRKWALDVVDGYGTRATLNAQADYGAALLAGAGVASLIGITAFDGDKGWIKGIPIGAGFLATVFGVYNNEAKATTYTLGANYLQRLLNNSERRTLWREHVTQTVIGEAQASALAEQKKVKEEIDAFKEQLKTTVNKPTSKDDKLSSQLTDEIAKINERLKQLQLRQDLAEQRIAGLRKLTSETCQEILPPIDEPKKTDKSKKNGTECSKASNSAPHDKSEAICLRDDVMDVMARVDRLNLTFLPDDVPAALLSVGTTPKEGDKKAGDWANAKLPDSVKDDLAVFTSPIVSRCGVL
jgi:hypothetical protein